MPRGFERQNRLPPMPEQKLLPGKRQKRRAAIVDVSSAVEDAARDRADAAMTADKEQMRGIRGFCSRIWKHNLWREVYRQGEIKKAKKEIIEKKNVHAGESGATAEDHAKTMAAVVDRFVSEYDDEEVIHGGAGEVREMLGDEKQETSAKHKLQELVRTYAAGTMTEEAFLEEKIRLFSEIRGVKRSVITKGELYADNLLEIAKEARQNVEHGMAVAQLDLDFDVIVGRAKNGVRTEAQFNAVDRIVKKITESNVGRFVNETTVATAVAIAASVGAKISQSFARSKIVQWATFGASALLAGGIAGAREHVRIKEERREHSRERAQGKTFDETKSPRRVEMEKMRLHTETAKDLMKNLEDALYRVDADGTKIEKTMDQPDFDAAMNALAEIETRIQLSDKRAIDLISYTSVTSVEQERLELDLARAKAKVMLKRAFASGGLVAPGASGFDEYLANLNHGRSVIIESGQEGINERDARFNKMKAKKVAGAVTKGVLTGLVIGATVQEIGAFFSDKHGMVEGWIRGQKTGGTFTGLEYLRRLITGNLPEQHGCNWHDIVLGKNHFNVPSDMNFIKNPDGSYQLLRGSEIIDKHLTLNPDGTLSDQAKTTLAEKSFNIDAAVEQTTETKTVVVQQTAKEYIERHPDGSVRIHRTMWYDNDTPKPAIDKNELRLGTGGLRGKGLDAHGNFIYTMKHMTADGSYHGTFSADAQALAKAGKLRLLLSMSRNTQMTPYELPIDAHGNVTIDPNSEIGRLFFHVEKGKLIFDGKFAECAQVTGIKNGIEQIRVLATDVGRGIPGVTDEITQTIIHETPMTTLYPPPSDWRVDLPPIIPLFGRRPLEPMKGADRIEKGGPYGYGYGYGGEGYGLLARNRYKERLAPELAKNPDLDFSQNDQKLIKGYFDRQPQAYRKELSNLIESAPPMSQDVELVITVPAYQEGKNLEKTIRHYTSMKGQKKCELVIFENHPNGIKRDGSAEVIARMQRQFPDLKIVHLYKQFDQKPAIGLVRKYLVDSVLARKQAAGIKRTIPLVSNDADLEGINENYVAQMTRPFQSNPKVDAVGARWDFTPESFKQYPLLHAAQRLWHFMDIGMRNYVLKSPELIGRNSAFSSGIYAAIGGYNENARLAEDLEIGWMIKEARRFKTERIQYSNGAWLYSNPRRAVVKMLSGGALISQYGDFHENEEVRKAPLDKLLEKEIAFDEKDFIKEVQAVFDYYARWRKSVGGWIDDGSIEKSFGLAMGFLGVKFTLEGERGKERVVITDFSSLTRGLKEYKPKRRTLQ